MRHATLAIATTTTLVTASAASAQSARDDFEGLTPFALFLNAAPFVKLIETGLALATLATLILLVLGLVRPGPSPRTLAFLRAVSAVAPVAGLVGFGYGAFTSARAAAALHITNMGVFAPGAAEAISCIVLALQAYLIALMAAAILETRQPRPV